MAEAWPHIAGRLVPGGHVLPVRIYFEDTDFSGVVYHGSYIRFMERGRSDFVRLIGIGHSELHQGEHGEQLERRLGCGLCCGEGSQQHSERADARYVQLGGAG